jgi:hypothetical protein
MNEKLKKILRVYEIFSVCFVSLLILAALLIWINIGKITRFAVGKAVDNYNTEITEIISDYLASSGESMGFRAIQMTKQEGLEVLRFEFEVDNRDLIGVDIDSLHNKSSKELASEFGITPDGIPSQAKSLVQSSKMAVDIYIYDWDDNLVFNRLIMPDEIADFLKTE